MSTLAVPYLDGARALSRLPGWLSPGHSPAAPADGREGAVVPAMPGAVGLTAAEIATLLLLGGAAAACTAFLKPSLGIPGSSILWCVFPTALGVALVPRRWAGSVVSAGALVTIAVLMGAGAAAPGPGALTSLLLTGVVIDALLAGARTGWRLYGGLMAAGLVANLLAFVVRTVTAGIGLDPGRFGPAGRAGGGLGHGGGRGLHHGAGRALGSTFAETSGLWVRHALLSYALAGLLAGLIGAVAWFRFRQRERP